jgi:hypothetical protein
LPAAAEAAAASEAADAASLTACPAAPAALRAARGTYCRRGRFPLIHGELQMGGIIYLVGLVVIVLFILSFIGLR